MNQSAPKLSIQTVECSPDGEFVLMSTKPLYLDANNIPAIDVQVFQQGHEECHHYVLSDSAYVDVLIDQAGAVRFIGLHVQARISSTGHLTFSEK
jgi:hypothetical protein